MLKIDVIRFEAQDVITTSVPKHVTCNCNNFCFSGDYNNRYHIGFDCGCDAEVHVDPWTGNKIEKK